MFGDYFFLGCGAGMLVMLLFVKVTNLVVERRARNENAVLRKAIDYMGSIIAYLESKTGLQGDVAYRIDKTGTEIVGGLAHESQESQESEERG